ncbi:MAG: class I SAM-dependent methyltransferase [Bacteroidetes bacterium]|nr:class I SAM-dependent methyltransferase [Bacteroidota bacterium]
MKRYHTECLICNSTRIAELIGYEKHDLVKCKDCDFVFMRAIPSTEELSDHYSTYSYGSNLFLSPITIKSYNNLLDEFEQYRSSNKILDVGCGAGFFLEQAQKRGWEVYGTEYSNKALELCAAKGFKMQEGVLDSKGFSVHNFDVITSFEVIEHINNPQEELYHINRLLRSGGLFYCTTPNFNSIMRYYLKDNYNIIGYPEHLSYYTYKTLTKVLKKSGFKKKKFLITGISLTRISESKSTVASTVELINSADEKLRRQIEQKWYLGLVKSIANNILTLSNTGMTLKGYFEKK